MTERAALIEYLRAQRDHADDWRTTLAEDAADLLERDKDEVFLALCRFARQYIRDDGA